MAQFIDKIIFSEYEGCDGSRLTKLSSQNKGVMAQFIDKVILSEYEGAMA